MKQINRDMDKHAVREAQFHGWIALPKFDARSVEAPDRLFINEIRCVFIVFKSGNDELSHQQERLRCQLSNSNCEYFIVKSMEEFREVMGFEKIDLREMMKE